MSVANASTTEEPDAVVPHVRDCGGGAWQQAFLLREHQKTYGESRVEIYTLEISFPYDDNDEPWSRTIEIKADTSLEKLHLFIQEVINFDNDHMYEFYTGRNPNNRKNDIPLKTKLEQIYPLTGQKLYYLFDFGDSWLFQIKKSRKKATLEPKTKYPRVTKSAGANPEQYPVYEE